MSRKFALAIVAILVFLTVSLLSPSAGGQSALGQTIPVPPPTEILDPLTGGKTIFLPAIVGVPMYHLLSCEGKFFILPQSAPTPMIGCPKTGLSYPLLTHSAKEAVVWGGIAFSTENPPLQRVDFAPHTKRMVGSVERPFVLSARTGIDVWSVTAASDGTLDVLINGIPSKLEGGMTDWVFTTSPVEDQVTMVRGDERIWMRNVNGELQFELIINMYQTPLYGVWAHAAILGEFPPYPWAEPGYILGRYLLP